MVKTLRIPDEPRFVRAFALAVDPGDTLGLLMEIGALGSPDIGTVRRTREALIPAYDRASDLKDWEQAHTAGTRRALLQLSGGSALRPLPKGGRLCQGETTGVHPWASPRPGPRGSKPRPGR